jgi:DNA (cytosine-5)-methyltransferase 1
MTIIRVLEDFAGPGGWDLGASLVTPPGTEVRIIGREINEDACATARAAGFCRKHVSVLDDDPSEYVGAEGYIASPPCQTFSTAGSGAGRAALVHLISAAKLVAMGALPKDAVAAVHDEALDERSVLVLEPLRVITAIRPAWVALEQVPGVLPVWEAFASILDGLGYHARAGVLNAEEYGVPQTRRRAILVAVRKELADQASWPTKTHSKYHVRTPDRIDEGYPRWVSMTQALNGLLPGDLIRSNYGTGGDPADRGVRTVDQPAATVTSKAGRNKWVMGDVVRSKGTVRTEDQPAPTITGALDNGNFRFMGAGASHTDGQKARESDQPAHTITGKGTAAWVPRSGCSTCGDPIEVHDAGGFCAGSCGGTCTDESFGRPAAWVPEFNDQSGTPFDPEWPDKRPATVVAGRGLVQNPGATANRYNGSTKSRNDGVRVTVQEAGILQSFPADYPWQGNSTSQYQRVGDAIPPLLAAAVLKPLLELGSC